MGVWCVCVWGVVIGLCEGCVCMCVCVYVFGGDSVQTRHEDRLPVSRLCVSYEGRGGGEEEVMVILIDDTSRPRSCSD